MSTIINASNIPLNQQNTMVPDVSGAMQNYFQKMTFIPLQKTVQGFQLVENSAPIEFWGNIMPFSARQLIMKDIGQRAWSWFSVYAEPGVRLKADDVFQYLGQQYRVIAQTNFSLYGYSLYEIILDYRMSGP